MKIFVGTMEHGELDFKNCAAAVARQQEVELVHYVVSNKPECAAHEDLFSKWNSVKQDYDLFLKVDADTVLSSDLVAKTLADLFTVNERLTGIQAWLHDYMTDSMIYGLTCIRNTVTVATKVDPLYCDRVDSNHDVVLRGDQLPKELNPAGLHCHFASELQAFYYGFHRGKKEQVEIHERVFKAWSVNKDHVRGMALMGFKFSRSNNIANYDDREFQDMYVAAKKEYDVLVL